MSTQKYKTGKSVTGVYFYRIMLLGIFFLALSFSLQAQQTEVNPNGYNVFYYPNGVKSSEGKMVNGKPDGYWITYYPSGVKKSEGRRKNFMLDSTWIFYDPNGDTTEVINYYQGKKNGWYYKYYTTTDSAGVNRLKFKVLYVDNKRQGQAVYFYPNGRIWKKETYKDNYIHGKVLEYSPDGRLITVVTYNYGVPVEMQAVNRFDKNGKRTGLWMELYDNGQVKWEATYQNDLINGFYKEYTRYGTLKKAERYVNGKLIVTKGKKSTETSRLKLVQKYYDNNVLKFSGTFNDSIPVGLHKFYNPDGTLQKAVQYDSTGIVIAEGMLDQQGLKTGTWKLFYPDGKLLATGTYRAGKKNGLWTFFYPDGQLMQKGQYKENRPDGKWLFYYKDGSLWREENLHNGKNHGKYTEFYPNGDTLLSANYKYGRLNGPWKLTVGDMIYVGNYTADKKEGPWKAYYRSSGNIAWQATYKQDLLSGNYTAYYDNKQLKETGKYSQGVKIGKWKYYLPDGALLYELEFVNGKLVKVDNKKIDDNGK